MQARKAHGIAWNNYKTENGFLCQNFRCIKNRCLTWRAVPVTMCRRRVERKLFTSKQRGLSAMPRVGYFTNANLAGNFSVKREIC